MLPPPHLQTDQEKATPTAPPRGPGVSHAHSPFCALCLLAFALLSQETTEGASLAHPATFGYLPP